jgi:hypothetical protein
MSISVVLCPLQFSRKNIFMSRGASERDLACAATVARHLQQYFSYIVNVSFIGGENHRRVASH